MGVLWKIIPILTAKWKTDRAQGAEFEAQAPCENARLVRTESAANLLQ